MNDVLDGAGVTADDSYRQARKGISHSWDFSRKWVDSADYTH
jgi:hypothetical protein